MLRSCDTGRLWIAMCQRNFPCRGCYGPPEGVIDQGAKLISEIGALIDTSKPEELKKITEGFVDPVGTAYRFGLADSILNEMKYK